MADNELITFAPDNPVAVLTNAEQFDALLGRIQAEVDAHIPDLETAKGRAAIKSLAYKVTRTKTALDDAGKELNAAKRAEIDAVDAVRRDVRAKLDALAEKARKPLDEWETAEDARKLQISETMEQIRLAANLGDDRSSGNIQTRIHWIDNLEFDADIFREELGAALDAKSTATDRLRAMHADAIKAEADAAELAALRQREFERLERERIEAEEKAAAERAKAEAEQRVKDAEAAEQKRLADIKAAEYRAAKEAADKAEREAQAKIDKANAEAAALKKAEDGRIAAEKKAAAEQAARDKDKSHRSAVMKAAKEAIMAHGGVKEDDARKIVLAIVAGEVPAVTLRF